MVEEGRHRGSKRRMEEGEVTGIIRAVIPITALIMAMTGDRVITEMEVTTVIRIKVMGATEEIAKKVATIKAAMVAVNKKATVVEVIEGEIVKQIAVPVLNAKKKVTWLVNAQMLLTSQAENKEVQ